MFQAVLLDVHPAQVILLIRLLIGNKPSVFEGSGFALSFINTAKHPPVPAPPRPPAINGLVNGPTPIPTGVDKSVMLAHLNLYLYFRYSQKSYLAKI